MPVALYARVSTTRQAEQDLSIPDQLRQMREWCKANGLLIGHEYVEPGASAMDDKRPIFQTLIADALRTPAPYEAILVHSLSRFFRDVIAFGIYEGKLKKHGVRVTSITQQTSDDPTGEMARRIFSVFDEYQSKENAKHTARAMRENARQGFSNGAPAPFGYQAVATERRGNRGRPKKRLAIYEAEAALVRRIYQLYLDGLEGRSLGLKEIAKHLNASGQTMRGSAWSIQKVHKLLSSRTYVGEHSFNVRDSRTLKRRPAAEWILTAIEPIVDAETFERVRQRRAARAPAATPPRRLSSPVLLTGLLGCGHCGAAMTLATGKSGRYRYYKCTTRASKGGSLCVSRNLPMDKVDSLVLQELVERAFTAPRLALLLTEARRQMQDRKTLDRQELGRLQAELAKAEQRLGRLYEAIEQGVVTLDDTFQRRIGAARNAREAVLVQMAGLRRVQALPIERVLPSQIEAFSRAIRAKVQDRGSTFAKDYLRALVDQITVYDGTATIVGSNAKLLHAVAQTKKGTIQVPSFVREWRARTESNRRPPRSNGWAAALVFQASVGIHGSNSQLRKYRAGVTPGSLVRRTEA